MEEEGNTTVLIFVVNGSKHYGLNNSVS